MTNPDSNGGWLFLPPERVPEEWRGRVVDVCMVPLLPSESEQILQKHVTAPELSPQEEAVARLAARGLSVSEIARDLGISERTVARRLNDLHRALGTTSKEEMTHLLASRGF